MTDEEFKQLLLRRLREDPDAMMTFEIALNERQRGLLDELIAELDPEVTKIPD